MNATATMATWAAGRSIMRIDVGSRDVDLRGITFLCDISPGAPRTLYRPKHGCTIMPATASRNTGARPAPIARAGWCFAPPGVLYVRLPMANEHIRDRGNLFANTQKQKPSQPDFQGDCTIDGAAYEIRGWRREDQLSISLAPAWRPEHVSAGRAERSRQHRPPAACNTRGGAQESVATPACPATS
jgi:hypothetical protein